MRDAVDIGAWLRQLGLERYEQAFRESHIDTDILADLTETDLQELGVSLDHRKMLLEAIAALDAQARAGPVDLTASHLEAQSYAALVEAHAERRQLTVLFCELVRSSELWSRLDPEEIRGLIHAYQQCCRRVAKRWDGHLASCTGERVLVYFGWPRAHENDVERAVRGGLELAEAVRRLPADGASFAARVGIATGPVMIGDLVGHGTAKEQAAFGETPNLAARVQALAEPGTVVVAHGTRSLLGGLFDYRDLGTQRLKGFAEPVRCWQVIGENAAEGRFEALRGVRLTPLVGREEEIKLLVQRWQQARDGDGQVVLLSGEPGIGKSRVALGLLEALRGEAHIRLHYQCSPFYSRSALHPVLEQMARAAGIEDADPAGLKLEKLETVLAMGTEQVEEAVLLLAPLLSIPTGGRGPPPQLSAERRRQRTGEILLEQLEGLAARQPLLMIFEDAQWIDPSTSDLVGLAIERIHKLPALLVVTFRSDFTSAWRGRNVTALSLVGLSRRQILAMVDWITDAKSLPAEVLERIVERTDGVPLFVEELTKTVLESGLLADIGNRYELAGPPALAIPASLHDSLAARLDRLGPAKEVAQIGAVIGRDFSHELLAAVVDRPETELQAALDQLVSSGLVFRRGTPLEATYSFKHALVRDAAYSMLLRSRCRQVHGRIARVLEDRFPETANTAPELLAHHYTEAGLTETAVQHWQRAGQLAVQRSANAEAIDHLDKGLELLEMLPATLERSQKKLALLTSLGPALLATRGFASKEVESTYSAARALCQQLSYASTEFSVLRGLWVYYFIRADLDAAHDLGRQLLKLADMDGRSGYFLEAHRVLGQTLIYRGDIAASRAHLEEALALYDPRQHRSHIYLYGNDSGIVCSSYLAYSLWFLGHQDQAFRTSRKTLRKARQLAHPFSLALALAFAAYLHQHARDAAATIQLADEAIILSTEQGFPFWAKQEAILAGWALAEQGQIEEGRKRLREGLDDYREMGSGLACPWFLGLLAEVHAKGGQVNAGLEVLEEALVAIEQTGERLYLAEIYRLRGELTLAKEGLSAASEVEHDYRRALDIARRQGAVSWELRITVSQARLWRDLGNLQAGRESLRAACDRFKQGFHSTDLTQARELLNQLNQI